MNHKRSEQRTMIAAERRRRIFNWALQDGSVNVVALAETLGVGSNTIRRDLSALHSEGKLIRSHGGAVLRDTATPRPPYSQTRNEFLEEKSWIGAAALDYVPDTGFIFIGSGVTTYQLVTRLPAGKDLHVLTNSLETALYLTANNIAVVDFLGGSISRDTLESDWSLSAEALESLYWDVTFIGVEAIDIMRGITSLDRQTVRWQKMVFDHGSKTVVLCDSSKIGRFSYAKVGPINLIDVLITDPGLPAETRDLFTEQGIELVIAGPQNE